MPPPVRALLASARGYYLRWWRYGNETPGLVEQALDRERWDAVQWAAWRQAELRALLAKAATSVPHYRSLWGQRGGRREDLAAWPLLPKESVRAAPDSLLVDGVRPSQMFREQTSGTTGKPVVVWWSRRTARAWYALFEARIRRWNGVSRADRWAILGGQLVVPVRRQRPPFWVWNAGAQPALPLDRTTSLAANVAAYLRGPQPPSRVYLFGTRRRCTRSLSSPPRRPPRAAMRVAISNAEPLSSRSASPDRRGLRLSRPRHVRDGGDRRAGRANAARAGCISWPEVGIVESSPGRLGRAGRRENPAASW